MIVIDIFPFGAVPFRSSDFFRFDRKAKLLIHGIPRDSLACNLGTLPCRKPCRLTPRTAPQRQQAALVGGVSARRPAHRPQACARLALCPCTHADMRRNQGQIPDSAACQNAWHAAHTPRARASACQRAGGSP